MTIPKAIHVKPYRSANPALRGLSVLWQSPRSIWQRMNAPDTLPHDMLAVECTVVLCFKLSVKINICTGGARDMTFSARCYRSSRTTRNLLMRTIWITLTALIDVLCAMLRGEAYHCETAWKNHVSRSPKTPLSHSSWSKYSGGVGAGPHGSNCLGNSKDP